MPAEVTWPFASTVAPALGWSETPGNSVIRSKTDAGPAKLRRRFSSAPSSFSLLFHMSQTEVDRLLTFYDNESDHATEAGTGGGVLSFDGLAHPRKGTATVFRFLSPPVVTQPAPGRYSVAVKLELIP